MKLWIEKMPYRYFPIEFSSYEDYVKYLKEKGLAIEVNKSNKVMTQEDKYVIEKLYIMDVKTLLITEVIVNEVDENKFALFNFMDRKCCYYLKEANIQTLASSQGSTYSQYIVSKNKKYLYWLKESFQWLR